MCQECFRWEDDYVDPEFVLQEALNEIEDLHSGLFTLPEWYVEGTLCPSCLVDWPCVTFLTAVGALNDAR